MLRRTELLGRELVSIAFLALFAFLITTASEDLGGVMTVLARLVDICQARRLLTMMLSRREALAHVAQ